MQPLKTLDDDHDWFTCCFWLMCHC